MRFCTALACHMQNAARDFNRFGKSRAYFAGLILCKPTHARLLSSNSGILQTLATERFRAFVRRQFLLPGARRLIERHGGAVDCLGNGSRGVLGVRDPGLGMRGGTDDRDFEEVELGLTPEEAKKEAAKASDNNTES